MRDERRLLDSSDPVPAIHGQATALLRTCLKKAHTAVKDAFGREMKALYTRASARLKCGWLSDSLWAWRSRSAS